MSRYFKKELPDSPIFIFGQAYRFEVLESTDPALIAELENCIRRNSGGIIEISADEFVEEVKKKETERLSGNSSKPNHWRPELLPLHLGNPGAAAASRFSRPQQSEWSRGTGNPQNPPPAPPVNQMPDPVEVPTPESFAIPPTAKSRAMKELTSKAE